MDNLFAFKCKLFLNTRHTVKFRITLYSSFWNTLHVSYQIDLYVLHHIVSELRNFYFLASVCRCFCCVYFKCLHITLFKVVDFFYYDNKFVVFPTSSRLRKKHVIFTNQFWYVHFVCVIKYSLHYCRLFFSTSFTTEEKISEFSSQLQVRWRVSLLPLATTVPR
jgi:hypothetical protein